MSNPSDVSIRGRRRSAPRASLACFNCRRRKIKCVFPSPESNASCATCLEHDIPCIMAIKDLRKLPSEADIAALEERVQQLKDVFKEARTGHPSTSTQNSQSTNKAEEALVDISPDTALQAASQPSSATHPELQDNQEISTGGEVANLHINAPSALDVFDSTPLPLDAGDIAAIPETRGLDFGLPSPTSLSNTSHLNADNGKGEAWFYGPTCQLYIQWRDPSVESLLTQDPKPHLELDSENLRRQLFETFWTTQPLSVSVVDRELFDGGRAMRVRSNYYSTFLEYCILACAARLRTSISVRALGSRYVDLARAEIVTELDRPNIASLQGFLLLSDLEATRGRDRRGYLYCGISCRLSFDFGLTKSCASLLGKGKITIKEVALRRRLFSGLVIYDKLWALYLGRTSAIPLSTIVSDDCRAFEPPPATTDTLEAWTALCTLIGEVTELLDEVSIANPESLQQVARIDAKINDQLANLPPSLALDPNSISDLVANAYSLHIQYSGVRVVLNKLLLNALQDDLLLDVDAVRLRTIMYDNAVLIARLISTYRHIYGSERIITVMLDNTYIAAAVLITHLLLQPISSAELRAREIKWIQTLGEILLESQAHYPVAARMRSALAKIAGGSPLEGIFGCWAEEKVTSERTVVWNTGRRSSQTGQGVDGAQQDQKLPQRTSTMDYLSEESVYQDMDIDNLMGWAFDTQG